MTIPFDIHRGAPPPAPDQDASLLSLANALLRRRGWIIGGALLLATIVGAITASRPRTYTASGTFMTQGRRQTQSLAGLASQLGLNLPTGEAGQVPQFYADLLRSRGIVRAVVDSTYEVRVDTGMYRGTLRDYLAAREPAGARREAVAIEKLRAAVNANAGQRTGVIDFTVQARSPELAKAIADRLLDEVNKFNLVTRQSQARSEREFTERRLAFVGSQLRRAEEESQRFMSENREFVSASRLLLTQRRLEREVDLQRQLYSTLAQAYEQARIEEVRDTPVITVVDRPDAPVRPDPRGLVIRVLLAAIVGAVLGTIPALLAQFFGGRERGLTEYDEFVALRRETWLDLTRPWRPLGRLARARRNGGTA